MHILFPEQIWERHYFVLTNEKLFFTREALKDEEQAEKEIEEPEVCCTIVTYIAQWSYSTCLIYYCGVVVHSLKLCTLNDYPTRCACIIFMI